MSNTLVDQRLDAVGLLQDRIGEFSQADRVVNAGETAVASEVFAAPVTTATMPSATPTVQPAVPTTPEPTLDEQLILASDLTDSRSALADLMQLWGPPAPDPGFTCGDAAVSGFECLLQRGSWNSLRQFDRPAILTLTDSRGETHDVVLAAINGEQAELAIGGVPVSHSIDEVSELWFGQFLIVWRPANGVSDALGPGSRSPNVLWLRDSLAAIDDRYRSEPLGSDYFDRDLEARVRAFQRDHRLQVDGLAGRQTQIIINGLTAAADVPHLVTSRLAQD